METETGQKLTCLAADGGASRNNFLMQFQADILGIDILRSDQPDTTGLGAAYLAGLSCGFWSKDELLTFAGKRMTFHPKMENNLRELNIQGWRKAVKQTINE
jgi:glycerol kinase